MHVVLVVMFTQEMPGVGEYLDILSRTKKRFLVVTTAIGSAEPDLVATGKRSLMSSYGQPTKLNDNAEVFVNTSGFTFSCHVEAVKRKTSLGVFPPRGMDELLSCVRLSLSCIGGTRLSDTHAVLTPLC
jgi:hypothetical protein